MKHDLPNANEPINTILSQAHMVVFSNKHLIPRHSEDVCPVCMTPVIQRNGHTVCISGMCRERVIEGCCGD